MKDGAVEKSRILNIVCVILVVAVMIYLFQDIFNSNYRSYDTMTADEIVQQETVSLNGFVVRDEEYIDGMSSGTVVPLVSDGKRVARGDSVAIVCDSSDEAANYISLKEARAEKERYEALINGTHMNTVDIEKLNIGIEKSYSDLLGATGRLDYSELYEKIAELEDKLAEKQIVTDGNIDYSDKIAAVDKKISELEAENINPSNVEAPLSGYYISHLDGYEKTVNFDSVKGLTVAQVDRVLKANPTTVTGKMGKIVGSYKWYIVSAIESKYTKVLSEGSNMRINLPFYGLNGISVCVESISNESDDGRVVLVLSCNLMNDTYANMRNVDAELILHEYTGYKVPGTAIRSVTADNGARVNVVYILRGDIMTARAVDVIYTPNDDDYVIVDKDTKTVYDEKTKKTLFSAIQRYDEVIVKGRNLENGKSIG